MSDYSGQQIRVCHKTGILRDNPSEDDSYLVELELGGVVQNIIVAESYVADQMGDA